MACMMTVRCVRVGTTAVGCGSGARDVDNFSTLFIHQIRRAGPKAILSGLIPVNGHSILYVPIEERCNQAVMPGFARY
jgi:hypothetical protein